METDMDELERTPHAAITLDPLATLDWGDEFFTYMSGDLTKLVGIDYWLTPSVHGDCAEKAPQPDLIVE